MDLERNFFVISILSFVFPFFKSYFGNGRNGDTHMIIKPSQDTFFIVYDSIAEEYNLNLTDLVVYSLVRSFCESNDNKGYYGSLKTLAKRTRSSVSTVQRSLNRLTSGEKPLLKKTIVDGECSIYTLVKMNNHPVQNEQPTLVKMNNNNKDNNKSDILKENIKENVTEDGLDFSGLVIPKKNYYFRNGKKVYYSNKYDDMDFSFLFE